MESGLGLGQSTVHVNVLRAQLNAAKEYQEGDENYLAPVSYSAVQGFVARCSAFDLHTRATKKSGKDDKGACAPIK